MVRGKKLMRKLAVQRNFDSYGEMSFPTSPKVANVKYKIYLLMNLASVLKDQACCFRNIN
jgi:hypothetical protein